MQYSNFFILLPFLAGQIQNTLAADSSLSQECTIKTTISCRVNSTHKDCNDIQMRPNVCEDIDVSFGFRYCNLHRHSTITMISGEIQINNGDALSKPLVDENKLPPMSCKEMTRGFTVNSCANVFGADMTAEGWIDSEIRCQAEDSYRFIRPMYKTSS